MAATDYDYILTRNQLVEQAYKKLGVLVQGESLTGDQLNDGILRLNVMVKEWEADGIFLWSQFVATQAMTIGDGSYAYPTDPGVHTIDRIYLRVSGRDTELEYLSWREFQEIENKSSVGSPVLFSLDHKNREYKVWPLPTATDTLVLYCIAKLKDWESAAGQGDFPSRWQRALMNGLALELAPDYPPSEKVYRWIEKDFKNGYELARRSEGDNSDREFVDGAYD